MRGIVKQPGKFKSNNIVERYNETIISSDRLTIAIKLVGEKRAKN